MRPATTSTGPTWFLCDECRAESDAYDAAHGLAGSYDATASHPDHDGLRARHLDGWHCRKCDEAAAFVAGWNMPGYLPETDPETFATLADAAAYLRETLARWLDDDEAPEDMTADGMLVVDETAGYADGWYTNDGRTIHLWAHRAE